MTTMIKQSTSPRLPSNYAAHVERIAAENAAFIARKRMDRLLRRILMVAITLPVIIALAVFL